MVLRCIASMTLAFPFLSLLAACAEAEEPQRVTLVAREGLEDGAWLLRDETPERRVRLEVSRSTLRTVDDGGAVMIDRPILEHVDVVRFYNPPPGTEGCTTLDWVHLPWSERSFFLLDEAPEVTRAWVSGLVRGGEAPRVFEGDACVVPGLARHP
jgi:hypothetical protein